jgi:hypothetical protein
MIVATKVLRPIVRNFKEAKRNGTTSLGERAFPFVKFGAQTQKKALAGRTSASVRLGNKFETFL